MTDSANQDRQPTPAETTTTARPSASEVVERFGGIRPMAAKLGVPVTTVQGWKERDVIPGRRWADIEAAAARHGVTLGVAPTPVPPPRPTTPSTKPSPPAVAPSAVSPREPTRAMAAATAVEAGEPSPKSEAPKAAAKPAPEPAAPSPYDAPRFAPWLALAAVIVVAAVSWSYWWPLFGPVEEPGTGGQQAAQSPAVEALAARGDALETAAAGRAEAEAALAELRTRAGALGSRVTELEGALDDLREWLARMAEAEGTASVEITGAQLAALRGRIAALERDEDAVTALAAEAVAASETLNAVGARLEGLEATAAETRARLDRVSGPAAPTPDPETAASLAALGERLAALESSTPAEARPDAGLAALRDRLAALETGGPDPAAIDALRDRLTALEGAAPKSARATELLALRDRVASLEGDVAGAAQKADLAVLSDRLAQLAAALGDVDVDAALAALGEEGRQFEESIVALTERIAEAERRTARDAEGASAARALVLSIGQLRVALAGPAPFASELTRLEALAAGDQAVAGAIAGLWRDAGRGIPTRALLAARFEATLRAALRADAAATGDWTGRVLARLSGVVSVRRTGEDVPGDAAEAVLARAEARLEAGDLAGAVTAMAALDGPAAAAVAQWLGDARARLAAEQALDTLDAYAVALLADDGNGTR